jgi:transcriptional regulator with XRE-family HTH domain
MHDFPKLAAQVRGARALLGWSQSYLAEGISVRRVIIADLESCKRELQASTLSALITELSAAGIVFTETGVELLEWPPRPYVPTGCATIKKRARRRWCSRTPLGALVPSAGDGSSRRKIERSSCFLIPLRWSPTPGDVYDRLPPR